MRLRIFAVWMLMVLQSFPLPGQSGAPQLTLQLEPGPLQKGVPQWFKFVLTNTGAVPLRIANPIVDCASGDGSELWLRYGFEPATAGSGFGCAADSFGRAPILERVATWKVLRPGESLCHTATDKELHLDLNPGPGIYTMWAEYVPPVLPAADRLALDHAGIVVPRGTLRTATVFYERKP